jgi:hypothetical protein
MLKLSLHKCHILDRVVHKVGIVNVSNGDHEPHDTEYTGPGVALISNFPGLRSVYLQQTQPEHGHDSHFAVTPHFQLPNERHRDD